MRAYVNIETKPGTVIQVVNRMRERNKEIISADALFGRFDAVLVIEAPALADLDQIVYKIIQSDPNVTRTETSTVLELKQPR